MLHSVRNILTHAHLRVHLLGVSLLLQSTQSLLMGTLNTAPSVRDWLLSSIHEELEQLSWTRVAREVVALEMFAASDTWLYLSREATARQV